MGRRVATFDWQSHPLGRIEEWPEWMLTSVSTALLSRFPTVLWFGPELYLVYNDGYRSMLGQKHPHALGRPGGDVWREIWPTIGSMLHGVLDTGIATWSSDQMLVVERAGYAEESYFTFTYSPIVGGGGRVEGIFCAVNETTEKVIGERRLQTLRALADGLNEVVSVNEAALRAVEVMRTNPSDLPFVGIYVPAGPATAALLAGSPGSGLPAAADVEDGALGVALPGDALVLPIDPTGPEGRAWLVAGVSPLRTLDGPYHAFYDLVASQISTAMARARAQEIERKHSEELAELDAAKTRFFANVSHEFRTPLTLLLGPIQEILADEDGLLADDQREKLEIARRNALRLLRLVNSLLDFSRAQAGRMLARFEEVDLGAVTTDIASVFESAFEQAGVELRVDVEPLRQPVYVDVGLWENVILNLVSNAFKFTLGGSVLITVREEEGRPTVTVTDTGVGIPDDQVPLVFDRFHRVEGVHGRSHEGSGIGLSLVRELVELHGGSVQATSTVGDGTTFTVRLLYGRDHLEPSSVAPGARAASAGADFVEEALRWLPDTREGAATAEEDDGAGRQQAHILVVDDNADMRAYLVRLLERRYRVTSAGDGAEALQSIRRERPDLVLSDVMMPRLDGLQLVKAIRESGEPDLPVVLLSARAGPESAVEGLAVGADDYLVKPFSAGELYGRVEARLGTGSARRARQELVQLEAALARARDCETVVAILHDRLHRDIDVDNTSIALLEEDRELLRFWHARPYGGGVTERYHLAALSRPTPVAAAIAGQIPIVIEDRDDVGDRFPGMAAEFVEGGIESAVVVPLVRATGEAIGALFTGWQERREIAPEAVEHCESVGAAAVEGIERIRIAAREHRLVQEFQERLLAVDRRAPTAAVAARYRPSDDAYLLGGDWYDVSTLEDGSLAVSIGDVVGKGLVAATVMSQLRSAVGAIAAQSVSVDDVVARVDGYASRIGDAEGSTLVYLLLRPDGSLSWCSAGHPPPLVAGADRSMYLQSPQRGPLASGVALPLNRGETRLDPTELVLLYTDGLVERRGEVIDEGLDRLTAVVDANRHLPVADLCEAIIDGMSPGGAGFGDDIAIIAMRRPGTRGPHHVDTFLGLAEEVQPARRRLRAWLDGFGLDRDQVNDVLVAVGEAVTNGIEHACRVGQPSIVAIEASLQGDTLYAGISDTGRWLDDSTTGPGQGRGRGFMIIDALTDRVAIRRSTTGTSVLLEIELATRRPRPRP